MVPRSVPSHVLPRVSSARSAMRSDISRVIAHLEVVEVVLATTLVRRGKSLAFGLTSIILTILQPSQAGLYQPEEDCLPELRHRGS